MSKENKAGHLKEAIRQARMNSETLEGGPFGAVICKGDEIIVSTRNTVVKDTDPTAHAEINAIRDAAKKLGTYNLSGYTIYSSCEPCPMCQTAIWWARLDACYYGASREDAASAGFDDELFYKEIRLPPGQRIFPNVQVDDPQAAMVFKEWVEKGNNINY